MNASRVPAVFQISDGISAHLPAALRPWDNRSQVSVTYAPVGGMPLTEPVWRVVLPAEDAAASLCLARAEQELDDVDGGLALAAQRLPAAVAADSFAGGIPSRTPEVDLRAVLFGFTAQGETSGTEFVLGDSGLAVWERANAAFANALNHLQRLVSGESWVETSMSDVLLARTLLRRAGNQATAWRHGVTIPQAKLHARALALAQESRAALARTISLAVRGATLLATLVTGPTGMLFALPVAWKFLDDIIAEITAARARP